MKNILPLSMPMRYLLAIGIAVAAQCGIMMRRFEARQFQLAGRYDFHRKLSARGTLPPADSQ
ncbi:MAG: hypothetical protein FIA96_14130 [Betaproteobacteria bacterium]|nr:hypothetical protein [Betaproteobacteria bacterium]